MEHATFSVSEWEHDMVIGHQERKAAKRTEPTRRYDEEILSVNWNPAIAQVAMSCYQTEQGLRPRLPEDLR